MQEHLRLYEGEGRIRHIDHAAIEREARMMRALQIATLFARAAEWIADLDPRQRLRQPLRCSARPSPS